MFGSEIQPRSVKSWNTGRIIGPKAPLKAKHLWELRTRLAIDNRIRDLAPASQLVPVTHPFFFFR